MFKAINIAGDLVAYLPDGTPVVYNLGDISFVVLSMALVWIMIPGVGLFYSGLLRRKNALSMIYTSLASIAVGDIPSMSAFFFDDVCFTQQRFSGSSGGTRWRLARRAAHSLGISVSLCYLRLFADH